VNPDEASSYCCRTALLLPDEGGEAGMLGRRTRPRPLAGRVGGGEPGTGRAGGRRAVLRELHRCQSRRLRHPSPGGKGSGRTPW
jgi:hypothetical protein